MVKLWSNDPDKWLFSPAKLHRAISILKNRSCAFLFARIIYKEVFSMMLMYPRYFLALTESYDTWLFLRTSRRAVFVLSHSKGAVSGAAVSELINRCQNLVRYPAGPHEPVGEKWLAGRAGASVHHLHGWECQEGIVLCRQQSHQASPGAWRIWSDWTKTQRFGQAKSGICEELFGRIVKFTIQESWKSRIWRLQKRKSRPFKITM